MTQWLSDEYGNPKKKGIKWDKEPSYCPDCNGKSFKTGDICKKRFLGVKIISSVTHHQAYQKGYTDKKGNHFCGKCNHITGINLGIKYTKKQEKEWAKTREGYEKRHKKEFSCKKCNKFIYGYEYYEVDNKKFCVECFLEKLKINNHFIKWWSY